MLSRASAPSAGAVASFGTSGDRSRSRPGTLGERSVTPPAAERAAERAAVTPTAVVRSREGGQTCQAAHGSFFETHGEAP